MGENIDYSKLSDAEWKKRLTAQQYQTLRQKGTDRPFSYNDNHEAGIYCCAGCSHPLFSSATKFDSHTGWPSFYQPINTNCISSKPDNSSGEQRTEVLCSCCGGHLGHVFDDGPPPTRLRYCINFSALIKKT